jgi:hypothetical protein
MSEAFFAQVLSKKTNTSPMARRPQPQIKTAKKSASPVSRVSPAMQTIPLSVSNKSMDNLRDLVKKLQCDVKKLELNLKLVDSDNMSTEDYNKIKEKITSICGDDDGNTEQFFSDMDIKRGVNLIKRVVTYLQMIAPVCGIINLTAVPYITSSLKKLDDTSKNALLVKSFSTFKTSYKALSSIPNNLTIDDNIDMLGLIENAADVDMLDGVVEIANPVTGMDAIKKGLFNVVYSFSHKTVRVAKRLLNPFKNNPKKGKQYNLLIDKCNKLWSVICLSLWLYIILMNLNKKDNDIDPTIIMTTIGGKKHRKSSRASKASKK